MSISIDKVLGFQPAALLIRERRAEIIASNIANADTPNYKSRDLDFKAALAQMTNAAGESRSSATLNSIRAQYRIPLQADTGDGNSVDMQQEKMAYTKNAMAYQLSLRIVDGRFKGLIKALRGE